MMIRTALWIGKAKLGQEGRLKAMLDEELIPAMRKFPGVANIKLMWARDFEDSPPEVFCQVLIEYASPEGMRQMLACSDRAALRPQVLEALGMFDGSVSHINYEVS